jgi:hypothetical protein
VFADFLNWQSQRHLRATGELPKPTTLRSKGKRLVGMARLMRCEDECSLATQFSDRSSTSSRPSSGGAPSRASIGRSSRTPDSSGASSTSDHQRTLQRLRPMTACRRTLPFAQHFHADEITLYAS